MWIEERNGKFKFSERYEDYMTGKTKKVSVTMEKNTVQTRKTAQRLLNERILELQEGEVVKKDITLGKLIEEYRVHQKMSVKESTYTRNYYTCNKMMDMFGEDTLVSRLNVSYINKKLLESGKDASALNEYLTRFRALIRWGYKNDLIEDIRFLDKLDNFKDRPHKEKIQDKYLEKDELSKLLANMKQPVWKLLTQFMVLSGLRFGEAAALNKKDVDYKEGVIHVTKTWDTINHVVTSPKSFCSIRDVYMQSELVKVCKQINLYMLKIEVMNNARSNLFVHSSDGDFVSFFSFNKYLKELSARVLGKQITTHALRHTHASLLLEGGVSIDTISRRLGHENSTITKDIYLHVTKKLKEHDNAQVEEIKMIL